VPRLFEQAQALTTLGDLPLVVLTASANAEETGGWAAAQAELAELSSKGEHRTIDATHQGLLDDDAAAAGSAHAIDVVVTAVRGRLP
jgi:hypothetical protein